MCKGTWNIAQYSHCQFWVSSTSIATYASHLEVEILVIGIQKFLNGEKGRAIVHLVLDHDSNSPEGTAMLVPRPPKGMREDVEVLQAPVEGFMAETSAALVVMKYL